MGAAADLKSANPWKTVELARYRLAESFFFCSLPCKSTEGIVRRCVAYLVYSTPNTDKISRSVRQSDHIGLKATSNMLHAGKIATAIGFPLNLFITINLTLLNIPVHDADAFCKSLRERFRKWITRPPQALAAYKAPSTLAWVLENPSHLNAHIAAHVPPSRRDEFEQKIIIWIRKIVGGFEDNQSVHVQEIDYAPGVIEYMLKGSAAQVAKLYNFDHKPQGWIVGQRAGISRNLGPMQKGRLREIGCYPRAKRRLFPARVTQPRPD